MTTNNPKLEIRCREILWGIGYTDVWDWSDHKLQSTISEMLGDESTPPSETPLRTVEELIEEKTALYKQMYDISNQAFSITEVGTRLMAEKDILQIIVYAIDDLDTTTRTTFLTKLNHVYNGGSV